MEEDYVETENISINSKTNTEFSPRRRTGVFFSFISLILLGILPIISNSRPTNLDALNFAFYLSLWELICSLPLFIIELKKSDKGIFQKDVNPKIRKKTLIIMGFTGVIFSASTFLYVLAFETAGTISAAIAIQTYPLFSILTEFIMFRKKKRILEILFTILMLVGIYYLGTEGTWNILGFSPWFLLALIVPILWSIAHVTIKNNIDKSPITPNQVTFFRVFISSIILFIAIVILNNGQSLVYGLFNPNFQIYGFLMGIVYYLELVNWFYAVKHVEVSVASAITTTTPVITMLLAFFFLNESIKIYESITLILLLVSLYGIIWAGRIKHK